MTAPINPCAHFWTKHMAGMEDDAGILRDGYRCEFCLEVRQPLRGERPDDSPVVLPGHYKCKEHGRYNCAEDHPAEESK